MEESLFLKNNKSKKIRIANNYVLCVKLSYTDKRRLQDMETVFRRRFYKDGKFFDGDMTLNLEKGAIDIRPTTMKETKDNRWIHFFEGMDYNFPDEGHDFRKASDFRKTRDNTVTQST